MSEERDAIQKSEGQPEDAPVTHAAPPPVAAVAAAAPASPPAVDSSATGAGASADATIVVYVKSMSGDRAGMHVSPDISVEQFRER